MTTYRLSQSSELKIWRHRHLVSAGVRSLQSVNFDSVKSSPLGTLNTKVNLTLELTLLDL